MKLRVLPFPLSVAKYDAIPESVSGFYTLSVTGEKISLLAETARLPIGYTMREDGWRALAVVGPLDFTLVGILSGITAVLAAREIAVFALSTFDTDYLLVKGERLADACDALIEKGYIII